MPAPRHLSNAPITEAIIDFRVKARPAFHAEEFSNLRDTLRERFPTVEERRGFQARFEVNEGVSQPHVVEDLGLQGYFFRTADQKNVAQFRIDGFTFNRIRPYESWDVMFPLAMELWRTYVGCANPLVVTRLAVRYINRIPLSWGQVKLEDYLRAAPLIPPELPQELSGFLTRITLHQESSGAAAHLSQALQSDPRRQEAWVLLDIDAFREGEVEPTDPAIEEQLSGLHTLKNLIFFNCLTDECLRQFE